MYSLLGMKKQIGSPSLIGGRWIDLKERLTRNLESVLEYYRHQVRYLEAGHVLEKLIIHNTISYELPTKVFLNEVESTFTRLAMSARLNTYIQTGQQDNSQMYGSDITEFFFAFSSEINYLTIEKTWENAESVKVLYHPCTDMGMYPLIGQKTSNEDGYAVIGVDVPLLLLQYKFYQEEMKKRGVSGTRADFLFRYPLLNALRSHFDIVILNRMYNRDHLIVNSQPLKRHPFSFVSWSDRLDIFQDEHIRLIKERSYDLDSVMFNIPLISAKDMQEAMKLPSIPATRQILWLLVLSRVKFIRQILELSSERSLMRDTMELATIKRKINLYRSDNSFQSYLPAYIYQNLQMDFDAILKIIG